VRLHVAFDGPEDGPVLVLSNSLGTDLRLWEPQLPAFAAGHRVLRYDHRGHGGSPVAPGPCTVEELARDLLETLDAVGIDRVTFCGLSLGGVVGLWLAVHAPERLERVVLACVALRFGTPERWVERARTVRGQGMPAVADHVVNRVWFTPSFRERAPDVVARHRRMFEATPPEGYAACCDALAVWDASAEDLEGISAPTLLIAGGEDPAAPPSELAALRERIGGSRNVVLDRVAHLANVERGDAFAALVLDHLGPRVKARSHA
jgi:3-oxoadipate enol-lactonase